jgi:hypothetical protein
MAALQLAAAFIPRREVNVPVQYDDSAEPQ